MNILTNEEREELGLKLLTPLFAVVGDIAAHDGGIADVWEEERWSNDNSSGWTYQDLTGSHGTVLLETQDRTEAERALSDWLKCPAAERGDYCYTHNPDARH